jgi:hypothetical protein
MKKFLIVFCSVTLVTTVTVFAYNSDKGPAKQNDGITELPQPVTDSVLKRGKYLVEQSGFNEKDLTAISTYLKNR